MSPTVPPAAEPTCTFGALSPGEGAVCGERGIARGRADRGLRRDAGGRLGDRIAHCRGRHQLPELKAEGIEKSQECSVAGSEV
jgi:hypothetical protein